MNQGQIMKERLERLRERLTETGAEALLVTTPANVRYLSGFGTPEDAVVLVQRSGAVLLTDDSRLAGLSADAVADPEVGEDGGGGPELLVEFTYGADQIHIALVTAVAEVQSANIHPMDHHFAQHLLGG